MAELEAEVYIFLFFNDIILDNLLYMCMYILNLLFQANGLEAIEESEEDSESDIDSDVDVDFLNNKLNN